MYSVADIARLITEDPDVYPDDVVLLEADAKTYLNYFNKSRVPASTLDDPALSQHYRDELPTATLADLPTEIKLRLIQRIQAVVDPALARYEQYFVRQVANGFLPISKIEEDGGRLNETVAGFLKYSKKASWEGSKSILDYPDWRNLENAVNKYRDDNIEYDTAGEARVIYKKTYANNVMSLLLGGPPEVYTYWFREVTSREEACKYGRGTQWCTAIDLGPQHPDRYKYNEFDTYHPDSGLYVIELQAPGGKRRPIFQVSGGSAMDPTDTPIARFGPRLANFLRDVLDNARGRIHPETIPTLETLANGDELERNLDY